MIKNFALTWAIIAAAILALAGGAAYYLLGRTPSCPMEPIQDWKTYRSDPHILAGFEFKYPGSWFMQDDPYSFVQLLSEGRGRPQEGEQAAGFSLDFYRGDFNEALENEKSRYNDPLSNTPVVRTADTTIGGITGTEIITKDPHIYSLIVSHKGVIYNISAHTERLVHGKKTDCSNVINETLRTFTFVRIE